MEVAGYRQIEHTADLAFEFWAASEAELLQVAARALVAELTDGASPTREDARHITLASLDGGDRLVQWLNEVLLLAVVHGYIISDAEITLSAGGLSASLRGQKEAGDLICQELKAVTYHDLCIAQGDDGIWRARVVIDV